MQAKESRKVFDGIRVGDPAIDWGRMATPPKVEKPCPACAGGPADPPCPKCEGRGVVEAFAYEPLAPARYVELNEDDPKRHARLLFFDGERPVLYRYRRLTRPQIQKFVSTATNDTERAIFAFRAGVIEIVRPGQPAYKCEWVGRLSLVMSEDELTLLEEEHGLDWTDEVDIGSQILARSSVPLDCTPRWQVPQLLGRVWAAAFLRSVERSPSAAAPTSDAPSGG